MYMYYTVYYGITIMVFHCVDTMYVHEQHNIVVGSKLMEVHVPQWNVVCTCTCLHEQGLQTVDFCV